MMEQFSAESSGELHMIPAVVGYKIGFCNKVEHKSPVKDQKQIPVETAFLLVPAVYLAKLPPYHMGPVLSIPQKSQGIKGFDTVSSFVRRQ